MSARALFSCRVVVGLGLGLSSFAGSGGSGGKGKDGHGRGLGDGFGGSDDFEVGGEVAAEGSGEGFAVAVGAVELG